MRRRSKVKNVIITILVIILAALCLLFVAYQMQTQMKKSGGNFVIDNRATEQDSASEKPKENPLSGRSISFSGIEDAIINKETVVQLENVKENEDFLMKYEITDADTGNLLFETDLIPAGQHVDWIPGETLALGVYNLNINEIPYYEDTEGNFIGLTQGCNTVTFQMVE